ncbi:MULTISPECIES: YjfB family protein [unclassified Acidovorax]|uniref:YjfB family protein n=1 Tax=unclassified Acidovorax TaxID=2684926 RepID=UPI0028832D49|nr:MULTISPECIES: YjfB family protein [unclassified Acidovorax]
MDVSLSNSIVNTATALASRQTSDAVNVAVLKKAIDIQAAGAATLLQSVQPAAQPALASSGSLGTQVNTFA